MLLRTVLCLCIVGASAAAGAQGADALPTSATELSGKAALSSGSQGIEFFEARVRPILVERCYKCHSSQAQKVKGKLWLDSRAGVASGGENGPVLVPGDPDKSRLIGAIRWRDPDLQMPPKQKLPPGEIDALVQWVKMGAPDPRAQAAVAAAPATKKTIDLEAGRKWWAFVSLKRAAVPRMESGGWGKNEVDAFVLDRLKHEKLEPSPQADPRTLIERAYLDLTGLRPTYEQVEAFAMDPSDAAYEKLIDQLLASPHYGERWGRYWLDVVRYGEDNPTTEATNPPYPFAWRYRDWVIGALNRDLPYDRFVKLQLAADLMPGTARADLVALGFLGTGPVYHKDGRLSKDVIETLYTDDWDERVDTVSRGLLGLTVACARCHDHKFDPISTRDYYSLASVFASTMAAVRPMKDVDAQTETRFMLAAQQIFYRSYVANLLRTEPGSKPAEARQKVLRYTDEMEQILAGMKFLQDQHPEMYAYLARLARRPNPFPSTMPAARPATRPAPRPQLAGAAGMPRRGRRGGASSEPLFQSVFDAGVWINGSDPDLTMIDVRPGEPHDLHVLPGGNVARPAELAPRGFPAVIAKGDPTFHQGFGRRELAERIFSDAAPLTARVIVNRVWGWHFGKPLVATPSDFGAQGERPTHPELLDDLAARFIEHGWSMKWLHRQIMLSATYRQASQPREDGVRVDPTNRLLWRMNPRRLDIEAYRDCILQASGSLDEQVYGLSVDLDQPGNHRRTVYARISRGRINSLLQLYDFPEATMHSPGRDTTTTPLQQLFVLNSPFIHEQAEALAARVQGEPTGEAKVQGMYHRLLGRDPESRELALAAKYLSSGGTMADYAQALLETNEVIFWP